MSKVVVLAALCLLLVSPVLVGQTTAPADLGALELRANNAFNGDDYATALPIYQRLAGAFKDQPDRLGPINEKIRVCQRNLAASPPPPPQRKRTPRTPIVRPPDGQVLDIAIKDLGNFPYDPEKGGNVPADVTQLAGVKIRTRGFMIPLDQAARITEFALVPSIFACCFGQPPEVHHTIIVRCPKEKAIDYIDEQLVVEGTLRVEEKKDQDVLVISLFEIDCTSVKPLAK